jgi:hypothetical protein
VNGYGTVELSFRSNFSSIVIYSNPLFWGFAEYGKNEKTIVIEIFNDNMKLKGAKNTFKSEG